MLLATRVVPWDWQATPALCNRPGGCPTQCRLDASQSPRNSRPRRTFGLMARSPRRSRPVGPMAVGGTNPPVVGDASDPSESRATYTEGTPVEFNLGVDNKTRTTYRLTQPMS